MLGLAPGGLGQRHINDANKKKNVRDERKTTKSAGHFFKRGA
jgi:hypothetical protein